MRAADRRPLLLYTAKLRLVRLCRRLSLVISLTLVVLGLAACIDRADRPVADEKVAETERSADLVDADASAVPVTPYPAPEVVFRTLRGEQLALRDRNGPTLIAFWSTSCAICLHEMPELAELQADFAPRGFEMIAVAMPYDRPDTVLELAEARRWAFPVALDIDGSVLTAFEPVPGTPTSFLINAEGEVISRRVGAADIDALRDTLDDLLSVTFDEVRVDQGSLPTTDTRLPFLRPRA